MEALIVGLFGAPIAAWWILSLRVAWVEARKEHEAAGGKLACCGDMGDGGDGKDSER